MSTRCRHDLNGCVTGLRSTLHRWREAQMNVAESWNDETSAKFHEENLRDSEELIARLITSLQEAAELVRSIEKRVIDPQEHE